jgi:uncharacterized protein (DUF2235 family)
MAKNIVILSDGTGLGFRTQKAKRSNVWKLWDATKKAAHAQQVTFYDEGLGAEHKREWRRWAYDLASVLTGLGISQNIKDCYTALIEYYEPGDRVFLFGFSRGAYTVRSLGGVLSLCGIPQRDAAGNSPRDRQNKNGRLALVEEAVGKVYKHYGGKDKEKERNVLGAEYRDRYLSFSIDASLPTFPYFIGVWDTVRALGIPGSSGLVIWRHAFHDATLNARVPYARQALSIDENRQIFVPELWDESEESPEAKASGRIKQVWFPGVHEDVGGGFPETELSDLALEWMIKEATAVGHPLIVDMTRLKLRPSHEGIQHDHRTGWGRLWIEGTRESVRGGKGPDILHESVRKRFGLAKARCVTGDRPYRPKALAKHKDCQSFY